MLTSKERAEKIVSQLSIGTTGAHDWKGNPKKAVYTVSREALARLFENITTQIEEAEREAYERGKTERHQLCPWEEGFRAAREEAAKIADAVVTMPVLYQATTLAERIRALEPRCLMRYERRNNRERP